MPLRITEYRIDQLIEEAISSSVLEGARITTRAEAKAMIRDGREPRELGERMVLNNYNAGRITSRSRTPRPTTAT